MSSNEQESVFGFTRGLESLPAASRSHRTGPWPASPGPGPPARPWPLTPGPGPPVRPWPTPPGTASSGADLNHLLWCMSVRLSKIFVWQALTFYCSVHPSQNVNVGRIVPNQREAILLMSCSFFRHHVHSLRHFCLVCSNSSRMALNW